MTIKKKLRIPILVLLVLSMILVLLPISSRKAYAAEIGIKEGTFKISDMIKSVGDGGLGLVEGDTLRIGPDTILVVDMDFAIDRIIPSYNDCDLIIQGTNTLTVSRGINVGTSGTFVMDSGTLHVTGPYPTGSPLDGIYAPTAIINGGVIDIVFDDPDTSFQCGFNSCWFTLNDGQVTVDISGTGSAYTCGIYSYAIDGFVMINGGTLDIDVENSFGYPYGIYSAAEDYVVDIRGGTTSIKAKRTNSDSIYADARGIFGTSYDGKGLDFYMSDGSLTVDVVNKGQDAYGITALNYNISGGTLDIYAGTEKEGRTGIGILTSEDANFLMSGGTVKVQGSTYTTASGTGTGIEYHNSNATRRIDISGGTLTAIGDGAGIYVYNRTDNELGPNQIYGNAKVTVGSGHTGRTIDGVRDGGWKIFGEAELTSTSAQFNGLCTEGTLEIIDTPTVKLTGYNSSGINRCAVYAEKGIYIGDTLEILTEDGPGEVTTIEAGTYIKCLANNRYAKVATIQPKEVVKAHVLFFDEVTGKRITDGSVMVYKNDGPWQAAGSEAITFNVGKGENFTLTAGEAAGSGYTFNGWCKGGYPTTPFNRNSTITQNITEETWYYAEFSPPKTEIPSMTLTSDIKMPVPGMTRVDRPQVTVSEEGIRIVGVSWLDMDGNHLAEDYVFKAGDQVMLMIYYAVDKAYKLSGDIESHTTLNGNAVSVHDAADTAVYQHFTVFDASFGHYTGLVDDKGTLVYLTDGIPDMSYTGIVKLKDSDDWYYVKNGYVNTTYNGVEKNTYGWWKIENGKVNFEFHGLAANAYGTWYLKDGKVDFDYTGFAAGVAQGESGWWYVEKGQVKFDKTDILSGTANTTAEKAGVSGWWYIINSKVFDGDTVAKNSNGWWAIRGGKVDFGFTGFAKNDYGWWYAEKGQVTFKKNDIISGKANTDPAAEGEDAWWYIVGSKVTDDTTVAKNSYGWWYVKNGKVDFDYTGVQNNSAGWWYIQKGQVKFDYNGFAKNDYGWWYCESGQVTFKKNDIISGKANTDPAAEGVDGWWYVKGSKVTDTDTVAQNAYGWWYVKDGKVDFTYTGLASNENGMWYIENGKVDFDHSKLLYRDSHGVWQEGFILNKNSGVFHDYSCGHVGEMSDKNKVYMKNSYSELIAQGYHPCYGTPAR